MASSNCGAGTSRLGEPTANSSAFELKRLIGLCRSKCEAYRIALGDPDRGDQEGLLAGLKDNLRQAAAMLAPVQGRAARIDVEAVAFCPSAPYAAALAAEAALELVLEEFDRLRWREFMQSCRKAVTGARLVWTCLAAALLAAGLVAGALAYRAQERRILTLDVLAEANPPQFHTEGINTVTETAPGNRVWRWAYGPQTELWFKSDREALCHLIVSVFNLASGQELTITVNDDHEESFAVPVTGFDKTNGVLRLPFMARAGQNIIRIGYAAWNHQTEDFAPGDARPLSVAYAALRIEPKD